MLLIGRPVIHVVLNVHEENSIETIQFTASSQLLPIIHAIYGFAIVKLAIGFDESMTAATPQSNSRLPTQISQIAPIAALSIVDQIQSVNLQLLGKENPIDE